MKRSLILFVAVISILIAGCKSHQIITETRGEDDGLITIKFIQLNDIYEIASLSGGKYGGMDKVAYVKDSISKENPNTFMFMAGDFLNPSLLGTIKYEGERIKGKQMVEVMNAMNFELVTFGNHEFDIGKEALQKRMDESNFLWTSANVKEVRDKGILPFAKLKYGGIIPVKDVHVLHVVDKDGTEMKLGFLSVTIGSNPQEFVHYGDIYLEAERAYKVLENQSDVIVGLTHVAIESDKKLAEQLPGIKLIMGGHEHNNMLVPLNNTIIAKADANAKTVYIHTLTYNTQTEELNIDSQLLPIDSRTGSNAKVAAIVDKWSVVLEQKIKEVVSSPYEIIYYANPPLDGTDSASRGIQTNLGDIITHAMAMSFNDPVDGAIVNGGSIRLDDMLAGEVTSVDIFRVLPFGGYVVRIDITGKLLNEVLDYGKSHGGTGAYLQRYNMQESPTTGWLIGGDPIVADQTYNIAFSDFLLKGYDIPFLTRENEGVLKVYEPTKEEAASDIRKAVIMYLKSIKK